MNMDSIQKLASEKAASAYEIGFCKYAESQGVDPKILARVLLLKEAQAAGAQVAGLWDTVRSWLDQFKSWYGEQNAATKALIGAGGGALLGGTIGSIFNRGGAGALLGGLGGAGYGLVSDSLDAAGNPKLNKEQIAAIRESGRRSVKKWD